MLSTWLIIITFAAMRSVYSALVEAFVTWGLIELFLSSIISIPFWIYFVFWYIVGFIVSVVKLKKIFI